MDAHRFDTLARTLTSTRSRRSAIGTLLAGGVLGPLGLGRPAPATAQGQDNLCEPAGDGGLCVIDFAAIVRQGPGATRPIAAGQARGTLRGYLRFVLAKNGNLLDADLLLDDGSTLPVVGQATGYGFQARIDLGQGQALVAVGVGEQSVLRCLGRLDGTVTGTEVGDLGEWHANAGVQNLPTGASGTTGATGATGSGGGGTGGEQTTRNAPTGGRQSTPGETSGSRDPESGTGTSRNAQDEPGGARAGDSGARTEGEDATAAESGARTDMETSASGEDRDDGRLASDDPISELQLACPEGESRCDGVCVNMDRDRLNCGGCGNACPADQDCVSGECTDGAQPCPEGETRCDSACVDSTSDVFNCGECGRICALDEACVGGQCRAIAAADDGCAPGQTRCDDICLDLQTDINNCGNCGIGCAGGEECLGGKCLSPAEAGCPAGQVLCGDECRNGLTLPDGGIVCAGGGAPPAQCPPGQSLCNGACLADGACQPAAECSPGQGLCYGRCRDFQNDSGYCGGCSGTCSGGYCSGGQCVFCSSSLTPCGSDCVDTSTDLDNCGACGNRCGTQCIDGRCTGVGPSPLVTCPAGQTRCGDACVDPARDNANCGACGTVCAAPTHCAPTGSGNPPGICFIPADVCIAQGLHTCGAYCANYETDPNNCGACYTVCGAGTECRNGLCYIVNPGAQTLAPGDDVPLLEGDAVADVSEAEQDSASEPASDPEPPAFSCPEGQVDCGGFCADVAFDPYNCGDCGVACEPGSSCDGGVCSAPPVAPEDAAPPLDDTLEETAMDDEGITCVDAGGACDPGSPGACCSGVCNDDGSCG